MSNSNSLLAIYNIIPSAIVVAYTDLHETKSLTHIVSYRSSIIETATLIKLSSLINGNYAIDGFAVDNIENKYRFTVTYLIQSSISNTGFRLITKTTDILSIASLQGIFPAFNWAEREIWDLSGVFFTNHPDLRRILTDYGFSGHPLRKDFPVSGFREVRYTDTIKQISYNTVELSQALRLPLASPVWSNAQA